MIESGMSPGTLLGKLRREGAQEIGGGACGKEGGTGVGLEAMCTQNHVAPCFPKVQRGGALGIF